MVCADRKGHGEDKNKQFILKAAAKYGFIGRYTTKTEISPFERFQLGDAGLSNNFALLGYDIIAHRDTLYMIIQIQR